MNQDTIPKQTQFRGSPRAQRIGSMVLTAIVAFYLAVITYSLSDSLDSTKHMLLFAFLWFIGLVALVLLSRAWRRGSAANVSHGTKSQ